MWSPDCQVLVIGAGPGGCATAIRCAQAGLRVVLAEREPFPRERPGETLHPGLEPLLRQLGAWETVLAAGYLRHPGTWVRWEGPLRFSPFGEDERGPWLGFQAPRADFDARLLAVAREAGVHILQPCRVQRALVHDNRVVGVETEQGPLLARCTVDAGGGRHWLARELGVEVRRYSPPRVARFGYVEGEYPEREEAPLLEADSRGWTWVARIAPRRYQWTRLSLEREVLPAQWRPECLRTLRPEGPTRGADVTWRLALRTAGPGWFLVGDAAAVLDPASSHGVLRALMSGMLTGHLLARALNHGYPEPLLAEHYQTWLRQGFEQDSARLRAFYETLPLSSDLSRGTLGQRGLP